MARPAAAPQQPSARVAPPRPQPAPVRPTPVAAPDDALMAARTAARAAGSLEELGATLAGFDGCTLKATAKNLCFYRGSARSRLMLIGEAPGRDEDLQGKPFVGRAGQLLDKMLAAISLSEAEVHITNIVYWRPPGNRTPTPQEAQVCRPFLERQAELVAPDLVLLLGGAAAKEVLGVTDGIMRLRGKWREITLGERKVRALATLHPAYLLRTPAAKRLVWRDLLAVKAALEKV
jgi:uracil-DNA glycosylase